jgi:hypothetical protein
MIACDIIALDAIALDNHPPAAAKGGSARERNAARQIFYFWWFVLLRGKFFISAGLLRGKFFISAGLRYDVSHSTSFHIAMNQTIVTTAAITHCS